MINDYYFKLLNVRVVCYIAVGNWDRNRSHLLQQSYKLRRFIFCLPGCLPATHLPTRFTATEHGPGEASSQLPTAGSSLLPPSFLAAPLASAWSPSQGHMVSFLCYSGTCITNFHLVQNTVIIFFNVMQHFENMLYMPPLPWNFPPVPPCFWNSHSTLNFSCGINDLHHIISCLVIVLWVASCVTFYQMLEQLDSAIPVLCQKGVPRLGAITWLGSLLKMQLRLHPRNT